MPSRRDLAIAVPTALGTALLTLAAVAAAQGPRPLIGPSVYDWTQLKAQTTDVGEYRQVLKGPTATLDELEVHVTTLLPGKWSHPPHQHPNEELVLIRQGTVETLSDGAWKRLGPGSVIFNASNSLHALKNVGAEPAVYDVVNWKSPGR
jgi:uncharacterized cupin superfamily protein